MIGLIDSHYCESQNCNMLIRRAKYLVNEFENSLSFFSFLPKIFKEPLNGNIFNERDFHPLIVTEKDYGSSKPLRVGQVFLISLIFSLLIGTRSVELKIPENFASFHPVNCLLETSGFHELSNGLSSRSSHSSLLFHSCWRFSASENFCYPKLSPFPRQEYL